MRKLILAALLGSSLLPMAPPAEAQVVVMRPHPGFHPAFHRGPATFHRGPFFHRGMWFNHRAWRGGRWRYW